MNYIQYFSKLILDYCFDSLNEFFDRLMFSLCFVTTIIDPVSFSSLVNLLENFLVNWGWLTLLIAVPLQVHVVLTISSLLICSIVKHFFPDIRTVWETWFGIDYVELRLNSLSKHYKSIPLSLFLAACIYLFLGWFILFLGS